MATEPLPQQSPVALSDAVWAAARDVAVPGSGSFHWNACRELRAALAAYDQTIAAMAHALEGMR